MTCDIRQLTFDIQHLTFNQWTIGPMDQWTNGPMDTLTETAFLHLSKKLKMGRKSVFAITTNPKRLEDCYLLGKRVWQKNELSSNYTSDALAHILVQCHRRL